MTSDAASRRAFVGVSALLFAGSAALTTLWCASMAAMGGMSMPGGWTMSMAWMRMPKAVSRAMSERLGVTASTVPLRAV
jgi:hypothetical protein